MSCSERAGHLALGKEVVAYCPACGDEAPGVPYMMSTLDRAPSQLYLRTSADELRNLALLVGCDAPNTPASLRVEVDHGGLVIIPDPVPPPPMRHLETTDGPPWALLALPVAAIVLAVVRQRRMSATRRRLGAL